MSVSLLVREYLDRRPVKGTAVQQNGQRARRPSNHVPSSIALIQKSSDPCHHLRGLRLLSRHAPHLPQLSRPPSLVTIGDLLQLNPPQDHHLIDHLFNWAIFLETVVYPRVTPHIEPLTPLLQLIIDPHMKLAFPTSVLLILITSLCRGSILHLRALSDNQ